MLVLGFCRWGEGMEGVGNIISSITLLVLILEGHLSTEDIESLNSVSLCCVVNCYG